MALGNFPEDEKQDLPVVQTPANVEPDYAYGNDLNSPSRPMGYDAEARIIPDSGPAIPAALPVAQPAVNLSGYNPVAMNDMSLYTSQYGSNVVLTPNARAQVDAFGNSFFINGSFDMSRTSNDPSVIDTATGQYRTDMNLAWDIRANQMRPENQVSQERRGESYRYDAERGGWIQSNSAAGIRASPAVEKVKVSLPTPGVTNKADSQGRLLGQMDVKDPAVKQHAGKLVTANFTRDPKTGGVVADIKPALPGQQGAFVLNSDGTFAADPAVQANLVGPKKEPLFRGQDYAAIIVAATAQAGAFIINSMQLNQQKALAKEQMKFQIDMMNRQIAASKGGGGGGGSGGVSAGAIT